MNPMYFWLKSADIGSSPKDFNYYWVSKDSSIVPIYSIAVLESGASFLASFEIENFSLGIES